MLGKKKKRNTAQVDALVGQNTVITGNVAFAGGLHVDGKIIGNVSTEDTDSSVLTVSDRGSIEGEVKVPYVVLNGSIIGNVHTKQHIELAANARVEGNVYYNLLEMTMGAEVNGQLIHDIGNDSDSHLVLEHDEKQGK